jgi:hypothetical protein
VTPAQPGGGQGGAGMGAVFGYGLTWTLSTILFLLAGKKLDEWIGTAPWLTLLGAFVGGGAGFWYMYRQLVIEPRRRGEDDEGRGG